MRVGVAALATVLLLLAAPFAVYIQTFGITISNDHQRWAEMGSAMSGLYSPLLAFLALVVVGFQVAAQVQANNQNADRNYIDLARADIEFFLRELDSELSRPSSEGLGTTRQLLHQMFLQKARAALSEEWIVEYAVKFNRMNPKPFALWSSIYPILIGLRTPNRQPYVVNFTSSLQKSIAVLSYETCVALDNMHFAVCQGQMAVDYEFSPDLASGTPVRSAAS